MSGASRSIASLSGPRARKSQYQILPRKIGRTTHSEILRTMFPSKLVTVEVCEQHEHCVSSIERKVVASRRATFYHELNESKYQLVLEEEITCGECGAR